MKQSIGGLLELLSLVESWLVADAAAYGGLAERNDGNQRMLDDTMVLYGSNMGAANTHDNSNLARWRWIPAWSASVV